MISQVFLPSPDSTRSIQKSHDQPVSRSSQADEEGSPTQASSAESRGDRCMRSVAVTHPSPTMRVANREEEAATDDSVVEQQEEHEVTSIWEVNDSSSECFQAHCEPGEGGRSQSATSLSLSLRSDRRTARRTPCRRHWSRKSGDRACHHSRPKRIVKTPHKLPKQ